MQVNQGAMLQKFNYLGLITVLWYFYSFESWWVYCWAHLPICVFCLPLSLTPHKRTVFGNETWPCHSRVLNLDFPAMALCSGLVTLLWQGSGKWGPGVWMSSIHTLVMVFTASYTHTHPHTESCAASWNLRRQIENEPSVELISSYFLTCVLTRFTLSGPQEVLLWVRGSNG